MIAVIECPGNSPDNYVAWLKTAGIIPVLIPYDIPKGDLLLCLHRVEGVVWTGGAIEKSKYDKERPIYLDTLYTTFEAAKQYNKNVPYPIFGICQGLEMLYLFRNGKTTIDLPKHIANENTPITFKKSILRDWFSTMRTEMAHTPCSEQHHTYGVDIKPMKDIRILSTQDDYVNILKYKDYPFYGVMFHVERPFDAFSEKVSIQFALFLKSLL